MGPACGPDWDSAASRGPRTLCTAFIARCGEEIGAPGGILASGCNATGRVSDMLPRSEVVKWYHTYLPTYTYLLSISK
jgi:hypothetical protein